MEYKIGEIVILPNGRKAEVVEALGDSCKGCIGQRMKNCLLTLGYCACWTRTDNKHIIYKEIKEE